MTSTGKTEAEPFLRTFQLAVEEHPARGEITEEEKAHAIIHGNLQVQARVDLIVHGTEKPGGHPAILMVFGFHFDGSNDTRGLKEATIIVEFKDKRNRPGTDPAVVSFWPQGDFYLGRDGDVHIGHSRSHEIEVNGYTAMPWGVIPGEEYEPTEGFKSVALEIEGNITVVPEYRLAVLLRRPGMESSSDDDFFTTTFNIKGTYSSDRMHWFMSIDSAENQMAFQPGQNYIRRLSSSENLGGSMIGDYVDTNNLRAAKLGDLVGAVAKSMLTTHGARPESATKSNFNQVENLKDTRKTSRKPVLSPEIISWLDSKRLLGPVKESSRAMSMAVFRNTALTRIQGPSSNEPTAFISDDEHPQFVDIPVHMYSAETYEFLGYTRDVAQSLWQSVEQMPDSPYSFLDAAKIYMRNTASNQPQDKQVGFNTHMDNIGISEELRDAILLPQFADIRQTESCEFWLENAMDIRWAELQALNENLRKVEKRNARDSEATPESESTMPPTDASSIPQGDATVTTPTASLPSQQAGASAVDDEGFELVDETEPKTNRADVETIDMWRGDIKERLEACMGTSDKALVVGTICRSPGDLSGLLAVPYFTPQKETAILYATFQQQLTKFKPPPHLLHAVVPKRWMMGLRHRCFWNTRRICYWADPHKCQHLEIPGLSWKELVYHCRRKGYAQPALEYKSLLIGHTAKNHHEEFHGVNPKKKEIEDRDVLQVDGQNAIQFAFTSEKAMKELELQAIKVRLLKVDKEAGDNAEDEDDKFTKTQMDNVYYRTKMGEKDFPTQLRSDQSNAGEVAELAGENDPENWGRVYAFYMRVTRGCCRCKVEGRYGFLSRYVDGNEGIVAFVMAGGLLTAGYILRHRK